MLAKVKLLVAEHLKFSSCGRAADDGIILQSVQGFIVYFANRRTVLVLNATMQCAAGVSFRSGSVQMVELLMSVGCGGHLELGPRITENLFTNTADILWNSSCYGCCLCFEEMVFLGWFCYVTRYLSVCWFLTGPVVGGWTKRSLCFTLLGVRLSSASSLHSGSAKTKTL